MGINLYVDDQRSCPPGWTLARTVDDAIRILADGMNTGINQVEMVDVDHDIAYHLQVRDSEVKETVKKLSDFTFYSPETFKSVVRYIALMPEEFRPNVVFHTANPEGEADMRAILETEIEDGA